MSLFFRVWTVRIRDATESDSGAYECQVNTSPSATRRIVRAVVVRSSVAMEPPDEVVYLNAGSRLRLTCVVRAGHLRPQFIMWYRDDRIISYSSGGDDDDDDDEPGGGGGGGVRTRLWTEEAPTNDVSENSSYSSYSYPRHLSRLVVDSVSESDSGEYRCDSDLTGEASVTVYVVRADLKSLHLEDDEGAVGAVVSGGAAAPTAAAMAVALSWALISLRCTEWGNFCR